MSRMYFVIVEDDMLLLITIINFDFITDRKKKFIK